MKALSNCSCEYANARHSCRSAALAMSYVPWHDWEDLFDPQEALRRATAFPSLELRFERECRTCQKKGAC